MTDETKRNGDVEVERDDRCFACAAGATLHAASSTKRAHLGTVYLMGVIQGAGYFTQKIPLPLCRAHRRELVSLTAALEDTIPPGARQRALTGAS